MMKKDEIQKEILVELGLESAPPKIREQIVSQLGENIMNAVLLALLDKLPEDARASFADLSERGDDAGARAILEAHIPNVDSVITVEIHKELELFKEAQKKGGE